MSEPEDFITPVPVYVVASIVLQAERQFKEHHDAFGKALLVIAEDKVQRIADPIDFARMMTAIDRLWRLYALDATIRPPMYSNPPKTSIEGMQ